MAKTDFVAKLDNLNAVHRAGQISDSQYEVFKAQLMADATRAPWPLSVRFVFGVVAVGVVILLARLVVGG